VVLHDGDRRSHGDVTEAVFLDVSVGVAGSLDLVNLDWLGLRAVRNTTVILGASSGVLSLRPGSGASLRGRRAHSLRAASLHDKLMASRNTTLVLEASSGVLSLRPGSGAASFGSHAPNSRAATTRRRHGASLDTTGILGTSSLILVRATNFASGAVLRDGRASRLGAECSGSFTAFGNTTEELGASVDEGSFSVRAQGRSHALSRSAGSRLDDLGAELCAHSGTADVFITTEHVLLVIVNSLASFLGRNGDSTAVSLTAFRVLFADHSHHSASIVSDTTIHRA